MKYKIRRPLLLDEQNAFAGHSNLLSHLLFHRGVVSSDMAREFILPDFASGTHDPFLLKDARKSAERVVQAIESDERIAIYSDYDADGIPGAAIFHDFFKRIGFKNFSIYIPHRHDEGFGVNSEAVRQLIDEGVKLLITLDCGITDVLPVKLAKENGIDVIITDHHEPPDALPPAFGIIDHKQKDCEYPDKNLCGSGVAYKLIQAILKINRFGLKEGMEKWFLDLVGIATLSDMVPLVGENRIFAKYGLAVLGKSQRKGLVQLFRKLKISQKDVTEDDIVFMVTPRINAASRMGVPMDAFHMLVAEDEDEAYSAVEHLDTINNERKGVVASLVKEVKKILRERHMGSIPGAIVLGNPLWRPALLGLVANSCAEEFRRPVFLWGRDGENMIKGSCRSEGTSSVVEIMRTASTGTFSQFGGHHHSGGFAVANDQIHFLEQKLNEAVEMIKSQRQTGGDTAKDGIQEDKIEDFMVDAELKLDDINIGLFNDIDKLAPFGMANPKPIFIFRNILPISIKKFGKTKDHVELIFNKKDGSKVSAISFFGATKDWAEKIRENVRIDLIATLERSLFKGRPELRLRVVDII
ncbi:MAG: single-stranded-DNA-specific exonuclease RecJ [Candidatus Paceibacterota bacterium]